MMSQDLLQRALFAGLEPAQLRRLAPQIHAARYRAGDKVFSQGDPAERVFVVERGEVDLQLYPEDGGCMTIASIHSEGVFGWSAALGRNRYTSSAVCASDCDVLVIRGDDLRAAVQADPQLGRMLLGRMALAVAGRTADDHAHVARLIQHEMNQAEP